MYDLHVYDIVNSNMTKILFQKFLLKIKTGRKGLMWAWFQPDLSG